MIDVKNLTLYEAEVLHSITQLRFHARAIENFIDANAVSVPNGKPVIDVLKNQIEFIATDFEDAVNERLRCERLAVSGGGRVVR